MIRFEDAPETVTNLAEKIQEKYFVEIIGVKIKYLFDTKKSITNGRITLGKCRKTDDFVKFFTVGQASDENGYQYIITLDKVAYESIDDTDRVRLLRHELRHVLVCEKEDKTIYKIYPHNIEDFVEEIEINQDDPRWSIRVGQLVTDIYEQREEMEQEK